MLVLLRFTHAPAAAAAEGVCQAAMARPGAKETAENRSDHSLHPSVAAVDILFQTVAVHAWFSQPAVTKARTAATIAIYGAFHRSSDYSCQSSRAAEAIVGLSDRRRRPPMAAAAEIGPEAARPGPRLNVGGPQDEPLWAHWAFEAHLH